MKELPNNIIRDYNEKELLDLKRIILDYIKEFALSQFIGDKGMFKLKKICYNYICQR